ncbi:MAG TPA: type II toxin-antitoxin system RelE/ParE family toxin [Lichenihabitans sp.]|jgi:proteic killer suppression protein|nr:type II toxin-antitoxin system RelE/ParE family toxin [Lichenihabitans sp.]
MIRSFKDSRTRGIFEGETPKGLGPDLIKIGRRKLRMIHYATKLDDLRVPPGNRLEALERDRRGQHSIRINDQFRACFRWTERGAEDVDITDYHDG